jgi:hypothetical protein
MTVDEVKIRIADVEHLLLKTLEQFEQETGCLCLGVAVDHADVTSYGDIETHVISHVQLDVSIVPV